MVTKGFSKKVLSALLCVAMLCTMMPSVFAGSYIDEDNDGINDYKDTAVEAAAEGAVLLENDGTLPIDKDETTVSVFGRTQIDIVQGGTGSGKVNTLDSESFNFIEGFEEAGINYYESLYEEYETWCEENPASTSSASNTEMSLTNELVSDAAANSDVAIVFIGRNAGEGKDRTETAGDWYLSDSEKDMLSIVNEHFDNVVVLLNTPSLIDLNWVDDYSNISAILEVWQPGSYGAIAIADILIGEVNPSGKLTDTWAYNYSDYPVRAVEGAISTETATDVDNDGYVDAVYAEDIFVGYRYFETFAPDAVLYEFGYGLSYTTFKQQVIDYAEEDGTITVQVKVTNTGSEYAGKDVVQLYYSAPQGELGKAAYELAAYEKTDLLEPGQSQTITLSYDAADMASYDDSGATGNESCYVLEAGDYTVYAGSSVKDITEAGTYTVSELIVTEEQSEILAPTSSFNVLTTGNPNSDGTYESTMTAVSLRDDANVQADKYDSDLSSVPLAETTNVTTTLADVANGDADISSYISQYALVDLVELFGGRGWRDTNSIYFPTTATGNTGVLGGVAVDNDSSVEYGNITADGPAGLRLTIQDGDTGNTAFPIGTMLACTWNTELLEEVGEAVGKECVANDIDTWLAPALNIHRDPLCGRNFEYYSEDPVISGISAAAITKGVQAQGIGVTIKHFAANSQETDRFGGNSIVSERALREIYLKGFEIVVETANPWYVMTSYNQINGSQTASNYELNTELLREEWGFSGTVMTDWTAYKDGGNSSMVRSQNDVSMPYLVSPNSTPVTPGDISNFVDDGSYVIKDNGIVQDLATLITNQITEADYDAYLIYNNSDEYICTVGEWRNDTTDVISGLIEGRITMGEIQRSATNVLNSLMQSMNFRQTNNLEKAEYTYNTDASAFDTEKSDIVNTHLSYINGYEDGTFGADGSIERAEVAQMLYNLGVGSKEGGSGTTFTDVDSDEWYYEAVMALADTGIIVGYEDGTFKPEDNITRDEFVTMIVRYTGLDLVSGVSDFEDVEDDHWAIKYINAVSAEGYIIGYEDLLFRPDNELTRAETVTVINRVLDRVGEESNVSDDLTIFPDVDRTHWAWADIVEAAIDHDYEIVSGVEVWL